VQTRRYPGRGRGLRSNRGNCGHLSGLNLAKVVSVVVAPQSSSIHETDLLPAPSWDAPVHPDNQVLVVAQARIAVRRQGHRADRERTSQYLLIQVPVSVKPPVPFPCASPRSRSKRPLRRSSVPPLRT
jgi:hypothetical protein